MTPAFKLVKSNTEAIALLGEGPVRFFEFGDAPQDCQSPYATWQVVGGSPLNLLGNAPEIDRATIQIDSWAPSSSIARQVAAAIRNAIEGQSYITAWRGEARDMESGLYRHTFNATFLIER